MSVIDSAVKWAIDIANDNSHRYSKSIRWGPHYDCSSFVISAFQQAGVPVKDKGAWTTANIRKVFLSCGFSDVTNSVNLWTGAGLKKGDVLLNENGENKSGSNGHASLVREDGGALVHARGKNYGITLTGYSNYPYSLVLRYGDDSGGTAETEKITYFQNTNEVIPIHPTIFSQPDMMKKEGVTVYINKHDITPAIGPINFGNSLAELATSISVDIAKSDAKFTYLYEPQKGDILRLFTPDEVFRGIILSDNTGGKTVNNYTAVDIGWYLNTIKDTYQFNNVDAIDAVNKLFGDLGIPIVYISETELSGHLISGVYIDKAVSEVLKDILNQVGGKWNFDIVPKGARIYMVGAFKSQPKFRLSENTKELSSVEHRGEEERTSSIEEMRNSVKIISDTKVLKRVGDNESYQRHGLLQEIVKIDPEKESTDQVAENKLKELNCEKLTRGFPMIVELSDNTHAGDELEVDGEIYIVSKADHEIKKGRHILKVELEGGKPWMEQEN